MATTYRLLLLLLLLLRPTTYDLRRTTYYYWERHNTIFHMTLVIALATPAALEGGAKLATHRSSPPLPPLLRVCVGTV